MYYHTMYEDKNLPRKEPVFCSLTTNLCLMFSAGRFINNGFFAFGKNQRMVYCGAGEIVPNRYPDFSGIWVHFLLCFGTIRISVITTRVSNVILAKTGCANLQSNLQMNKV